LRFELTVCSFRPRTANEEVVRFNIPINEILVMDSLYTGNLKNMNEKLSESTRLVVRTICLAAIQTVLMLNLRPQISKRSSRLGPSRSITRILCKPSCPKWYT
jgi:hypothetical protein